MVYKARHGQQSYGEPIGILMLDTCTPFIPGDVGNATTWPFPVRYRSVPGFTVQRALDGDNSVIDEMIGAARDLEQQGVRAITGDCGFMALHQKLLGKSARVPVFLSSLLQLPFMLQIVPESKLVGILTVDSSSLNLDFLESLGIDHGGRVRILGLQNKQDFRRAIIDEAGELDAVAVEREVTDSARDLVASGDIGAILLECSVLPPYGAAVREATELPVFDYYTMIHHVYTAVVKSRFSGYM